MWEQEQILGQRNGGKGAKLLGNTDNSNNSGNTKNTMRQRTFDDYLRAIKMRLQTHQKVMHDGMLVAPSGAELRALCLTILRNGLNVVDEKTFRVFFEVADDSDLQREISRFDTERFRTVINFLRGTTQNTDKKNLNLIAILIDFPERPLSKFLQGASDDLIKKPSSGGLKSESHDFKDEGDSPKKKRRIVYWFTGAGLISAIVIFFVFKYSSPERCMVWQKDHYVQVSCQDNSFDRKSIRPMYDRQFRINKIDISGRPVFFVDGKPKVWYLKHNNEYDFFDGPGYHPVYTDKELNPVTPYIAQKVYSGEIKAN